ncbi:CoA transferase [Ramlibacter sp. G-1-2-2]|uniref:CoA transferase n=1 Tax=Ramlibacter agri TaxID=2728837 RepID=A0A848GYN3_9BURK|nr:CoA transferase [Ramlibacter agri]NML43277.1 CoA transferase [Ramlibacter agri]
MSGGPLEGVRVLDLTSVVVGPVATQFLADYGADVIKVEPPEGDLLRKLGGKSPSGEMSAKFLHVNRNKRSIVLDLKRDDAREVLKRLCAEADVVVVNMRGAALERAGLSAEALRKGHPRLIHCWLAGFGQGGRYADKPAYDTIIQGSSGVSAALQRLHGTPSYSPFLMADHTVGLIAVQMILLALYRREKTGLGDAIQVPMFENMAAFMLTEHMSLQTFEPPLGPTGDPRILDPQNRPVPTKDGYICISANTDAQTFAFFDAIGRPELRTDPRFNSVAARFANVQEYFDFRYNALRERTTNEWIAIFDQHSVPAMPFHTFESLMEDPHLEDVELLQRVQHPSEGPIWNIGLPNRLESGARSDYLPPPVKGQHTNEVLAELGMPVAEIDTLTGQLRR